MNGAAPINETVQGGDADSEHSTEPPDDELIDFDAFYMDMDKAMVRAFIVALFWWIFLQGQRGSHKRLHNKDKKQPKGCK